jgi:HD-GYP domain-containing protein (c-di-GMP phosphodiesterase class II)
MFCKQDFIDTSYPDRLKGEKIELGTRILTVADSFEAITSDRPYRKALSLDIALDELRKNQGTQFDPDGGKSLYLGPKPNPGIIHQQI